MLYTNKNMNKYNFIIMHFVLEIIIVEWFLYWYHINDIHKYKFEDFLILKTKRMVKIREREKYIRHSRPHFVEWQDVHGKKHPWHVERLQSHRSVWSEAKRPDLSYNGLLELKF